MHNSNWFCSRQTSLPGPNYEPESTKLQPICYRQLCQHHGRRCSGLTLNFKLAILESTCTITKCYDISVFLMNRDVYITSTPLLVSNRDAMFVCQLMEVLQNVLGDQFLGIYSITFSPGSVLVNSVVRLSSLPSDSDISNVEAGLTYTFAQNGFVVDQISSKKHQTEGN